MLDGYWHSLGTTGANDNSQLDPYAASISAGAPNNLTADFGYYVRPAAVGNFVWLDSNGNGIQDAGEPGIDGVLVSLQIAYPGGATSTVLTRTGDDPATPAVEKGWYSVANLLLDEDYNTGTAGDPASAGLPKFTLSVDPVQDVLSTYEPTTTTDTGTAFTTSLTDSNRTAGTLSQPIQGVTNTVQDTASPGSETDPAASYDFGFRSPTGDELDYGDAPDTGVGTAQGNYQTLASDSGPSHVIIPTLRLGAIAPDMDNGLLQDVHANADDASGIDDEDGVTTLPVITTTSSGVSLSVNLFNNTGGNATVACWIDLNRDGDFTDPGEGQAATVASSASLQTVPLTFSGFAAPVAGQSYVRCRVATSETDVDTPTGAAADGEVEDYAVTIGTGSVLYDYGDAPDTGTGSAQGNYQTLQSDNGPRHLIVDNLRLGQVAPDADGGDLQNTAANADNSTGVNDEEGVSTLPIITVSSTNVSLDVGVFNDTGSDATLACWIDFNRDGVFAANEKASAPVSPAGTQQLKNLGFSGFGTPIAGQSYLRCRLANASGDVTDPTGSANSGEVEDYAVMIGQSSGLVDYGDAPDAGTGTGTGNYNTVASNGGPSHVIVPNLRLGLIAPDGDNGFLQNTAASADDFDGADDEDGVARLPLITASSTSVSLEVSVFNATGGDAALACWIDFNRNGVFENGIGERASATVTTDGSQQTVNLTFGGFDSPLPAGDTYLRCRLASNAGDVDNPTGAAASGEVEDYRVPLRVIPTLVSLADFRAYEDAGQVVIEWTTAFEAGTLGFHLERLDEGSGQYEQVNAELLLGLLAGPQGGVYRFVDAGAVVGVPYSYQLVEVEANGTERVYGPFEVRAAPQRSARLSLRSPRRRCRRRSLRSIRRSIRRSMRPSIGDQFPTRASSAMSGGPRHPPALRRTKPSTPP